MTLLSKALAGGRFSSFLVIFLFSLITTLLHNLHLKNSILPFSGDMVDRKLMLTWIPPWICFVFILFWSLLIFLQIFPFSSFFFKIFPHFLSSTDFPGVGRRIFRSPHLYCVILFPSMLSL